jgi:hypothetical protein
MFGAREGIGGVLGVILLCGWVYLKFERAAARAERNGDISYSSSEERDNAANLLVLKTHAYELMEQCGAQSATKAYLAWGVDTYHEEAVDQAGRLETDGVLYRNAMMRLVLDRAKADQRTDVVKAMATLESGIKKAKPETWWQIPAKGSK